MARGACEPMEQQDADDLKRAIKAQTEVLLQILDLIIKATTHSAASSPASERE